MAYILCKTNRLNAESQSDNVSITKVMERLDIASMLERAQNGILDLNAYARPRAYDLAGDQVDLDNLDVSKPKLDAILDSPQSILNDTFGASRETASEELNRHISVANMHKKPVHRKEEDETTQPIQGDKDDE